MDCPMAQPKTAEHCTPARLDRTASRSFTVAFRQPLVGPAPRSCDDSGCWAGLTGPVGVPVALGPDVPAAIVPIRCGRDA